MAAATPQMPVRGVRIAGRTIGFAVILFAAVAGFWPSLAAAVRLGLTDDTHSHILLVPFLTAGLIWMNRHAVFVRVTTSLISGAACLLAGGLIEALRWRLGETAQGGTALSLAVLAVVLVVWSGFLFCYGAGAFRAALFPMLFLLLAVPLPVALVDRLILWLQQGSSEVTYWLFRATGTPVLRHGFVFAVPGQTIEVAQECSGIRSSLAMLITCLLAGYLFLRTAWARLTLLLATFPMLIIKNGIRIVTLTLLSIHVDPGFLHGKLHHQGGFVFFVLGLVILWPLLRWLQRVEARSRAFRSGSPGSNAALASGAG